jgi:hypothetical protein
MAWKHRSRPSKEIQSNLMRTEGHTNRLLGPKTALPSPWWRCNCWALLWRLQQAIRPKLLGFCTEESAFSTITQGPTLPTDLWLVKVLPAGRLWTAAIFRDPNLMPDILSLSATSESAGWQARGNGRRREASCHLLATDTWQLFFFCLGIKGLEARDGKMTTRQWWIHRGLRCTAR